MYFSVILPGVTYSIVTWASCCNLELFGAIEKLHSRAAKLLYNLEKDTSHDDSLKKAKWHSLDYISKTKLFKVVHGAYNDLLPEQLSENIIVKRSSSAKYSLRGSDGGCEQRHQSVY